MTEIELKAHVRDPSGTEERLRSFCTFRGETVKKDEYWKNPAGKTVRIREETGKPPVLTWKVKTLNGGVEVNDEKEFSVSSGSLCSEFLKEAGFSPSLRKEKRTKTYTCGAFPEAAGTGKGFPASLELSEVAGLGFFLEIEIMLDKPDGETEKEARQTLGVLLARAGIPESEIEERYYSELLALKDASPRKSSVAK